MCFNCLHVSIQRNPVITAEYVDELEKIGHAEAIEFSAINDGGFFYIHRSCASWSFGVGRDTTTGALSNLEVVVAQSLSKKCYFCSRYGASLSCKVRFVSFSHCVQCSLIQTETMFRRVDHQHIRFSFLLSIRSTKIGSPRIVVLTFDVRPSSYFFRIFCSNLV